MNPEWNLTGIERRGLKQPINMADGHARQTLSTSGVAAASARLMEILALGSIDIPSSEARFLEALGSRMKSKYPDNRSFILYSASISIDLLAKLVRARHARVHLMTPTFDNLAALMKMNGVVVDAISEDIICPISDFERMDTMDIEALVVVMPNNPTGAKLAYTDLVALLHWASRNRVLLALDMSFRYLISDYHTDILSTAEAIGASVILIDDTGKVLSFFDSKISVVSCTEDLAAEVRRIHEEILLNTSALEMEMLGLFLDPNGTRPDELQRVHSLVRNNRHLVQRELRSSGIEPLMEANDKMSIEWVRLDGDATKLVRRCDSLGLQLLPGRLFYWDRPDGSLGQNFFRVALMRDEEVVAAGCDILRLVLKKR